MTLKTNKNFRARIEDTSIVFYNAYEERVLIKTIPGRRWYPKEKVWRLSYDIDNTKAVNAIFGLALPLPPLPKKPTEPLQHYVIPTLYAHQRHSVTVAMSVRNFADLSEPGTGKTLVQIELMFRRPDAMPVLVICPKSIMRSVWERQISEVKAALNQRDPRTVVLQDTIINNTRTIKKFIDSYLKIDGLDPATPATIFILNYDQVPDLEPVLKKIPWGTIILDESTRIKNPNAKRSKAIIHLRDTATFRNIMTGTVAPNSLLDTFNQFRFLDPTLFGESFYAFRQRWFHQEPWDNFGWYINEDTIPTIRQRLSHFSVQHRKRECVDLPPIIHAERTVEMTPALRRLYVQMRDELLVEINEQIITAPQAAAKMAKLRQIASGFIYGSDIGFSDRRTHEIPCNKYTELTDLLDDLDEQQVIIFTHFNATSAGLVERLTWDKFKAVGHYGSVSTKDKAAAVKNFEDGAARLLVANVASTAHGFNFQFCSNIIFYEHDFSLEAYEQAVQRIERIGQKNKMTVFHLLTAGTLEPAILKKLNDKIDINKALDLKTIKEMLK